MRGGVPLSREEASSIAASVMGHGPWLAPTPGEAEGRAASERPAVEVDNIVSTCYISGTTEPINLELLSRVLPCSDYDRRRFAAITIRIDNPRCTSLLFTSGKLVVTGVKSWNEGLLSALAICRILNLHVPGVRYSVRNCVVQNIVAHSGVVMPAGHFLDLPGLYEDFRIDCTYQRNMFPGLIYRMKGCPVVLLCFYSGKVVLTGGKDLRDVDEGWDTLWKVIRGYVRRKDC